MSKKKKKEKINFCLAIKIPRTCRNLLRLFRFVVWHMIGAVLPQRCCCAPDVCVMGAADTSALDDNFCRVPLELCMETRWSLWCYYLGILLAMIAIVLLVNSIALHNKVGPQAAYQVLR